MNHYKPNKLYKELDTGQLKNTYKNDYNIESEYEKDDIISNIKYIKLLPNNWIIKNNNSLQFDNLNEDNISLFKNIPNVFVKENDTDNAYWEYTYDIDNIIYNLNNQNKNYIINIINQIKKDIISSNYNKNLIKPNLNIKNLENIKIYKSAKLYKNNNEICRNIDIDAQIYRIIFSYKISDYEYIIEIVVSELNREINKLNLLYITEAKNVNKFSKLSSIILNCNQYYLSILNTNNNIYSNSFGLSILKTNNMKNNIYVYPTIYAIINIPNNYRVKKIKINNNQENCDMNINIWEGFLDSNTSIRLHQTGYFNNWIYLNNTHFIGKDIDCNYSKESSGNYLLVEIPYIDINKLIIYGGEILLTKSTLLSKDNYVKQVEICNTNTELYTNTDNIQHYTECNIQDNINYRFRHGLPSLEFNKKIKYPLLNNKYIISSNILDITK